MCLQNRLTLLIFGVGDITTHRSALFVDNGGKGRPTAGEEIHGQLWLAFYCRHTALAPPWSIAREVSKGLLRVMTKKMSYSG